MPRHDRAYGATVPTKRSGGGTSRRTRKRGKNTYFAKQFLRRPTDGSPNQPANATAEAAKPQGAQGRQQGAPQAKGLGQ